MRRILNSNMPCLWWGRTAMLGTALALLGMQADAQISAYSRTVLSGLTYTQITGGTALTVNGDLTHATLGATSDDGGVTVTLPFTFTYDGNAFTEATFCTNGWVGMGPQTGVSASQGRTGGNLFSTTIPQNTIAAWFGDGNANFGSGGSMVHGTVGTDVYAFEWRNATGNGFSVSTTNQISFQIRIYGPLSSAPGQIELLYGAATGTPSTSRSLGIENATGGSGNYKNALNGLSTSTTTSSAWVGNGNGYRFSPPVPIDIAVTALFAPATTGCYGATQTVTAVITNSGTATLDFSLTPATVATTVTGAGSASLTGTLSTGTLAPAATANVVMSTTLNMTATGTYNFALAGSMIGDGNAGNNNFSTTRTNTAPVVLPQTVNFTGFTGANLTTVFPNWREGAGATLPAGTTSTWTFNNVWSPANTTARLNLFGSSVNEWVVGPKVVATASTVLNYKIAITDWSSGGTTAVDPSGMQTTDDRVIVRVSTDCGVSFSDVFTHNAANTTTITNSLVSQSVSLSAYAGQEIIVAFFGTSAPVSNTPDYDFHIDDIFLGTVPSIDMAATALVAPVTTGCFGATENVTVTILNNSTTPIDFSVDNVTVTTNVTGAGTATLSQVLTTGTLANGATQNVTMSTTLDMTAPGVYTFNANTAVTGDGNPGNNAMTPANRTTLANAALPQTVDFTGFNGGNLTTLFPNWREGAGAALPAGTGSTWTSSTSIAGSGTTAKINLFTNNRNEWIVGPKAVAAAGTVLQFKVAITDFASSAADPSGMQTTDDRVIVRVSTDCGASFSDVFTFNAANTTTITNALVAQSIPLGSYAGQEIIVAFFGTDGPIANTPDYDFHIDDVFLGTPPAIDMSATALVTPAASGCYGAAQNVTVSILNNGSSPIDFSVNNVTVTTNVTGTVTATLSQTLTSGTLAIGATQNVTMSTTLNMSTGGAYTFNANTAVAGDGNAGNDAITPVNRTSVAPVATPYTQDFSAGTGTPAGWNTSGWTINSVHGETDNGLFKNLWSSATTGQFTIVKLGFIAATDELNFDYRIVNFTSYPATATPNSPLWGSIVIEASTNCGGTFAPFQTIDPSNHVVSTAWAAKNYSLSGFAGQELILRVSATRTNGDYYLDFDNFDVSAPLLCTAPTAVATLVPNCGTGGFTIEVDLSNLGDAPNVDITEDVNGGGVTVVHDDVSTLSPPNYVLGPYSSGDVVDVTVTHNGDNTCDINLGNFTFSGGAGNTCHTTGVYPVSNTLPTTDMQICVSNPGTQLGVDAFVASVDLIISHTFNGDIEAQLISPNNVTVNLVFDRGSTGDNLGDPGLCPGGLFTLQDGGAALTTVTGNNVVGVFNPEQPLTGFHDTSDPNGVWTLRVTDDAGGDDGDIRFGAVNIVNCIAPTATATIVPTCGTNEFTVEVTVTSTGSGATVDLSSDLLGVEYTGVDGTNMGGNPYVMGPYTSGSSATLTMLHESDPGCDVVLGAFNYACPPPNDLCADAITITCNSITSATTTNATNADAPATCVTSLNTAPGVWYTIIGIDGDMTAAMCGTSYDGKMGVFDGTGGCGGLLCIEGEDDDFTNCGDNDPFITWAATAGTPYYIYVTGFGTGSGAFTLEVVCSPVTPPCVENEVTMTIKTDGFGSETSWYIIPQGNNIPVCSGGVGGTYTNNTTFTETCCLFDGCYRLRVEDSFGDGMQIGNGSYVLTDANGDRIIDNPDPGNFGAESSILNNGGFCLPLGPDRIIASTCDRVDMLSTSFVVAKENALVSAQFGVTNSTSGYQFWFYEPNGTYSRRIFLSHANPMVGAPPGATAAAHVRPSTMVTNPVPANVLMNVKVRGRIAGVYNNFGPACLYKIDPVAAACPLTKLIDDVNHPFYSCGRTNLVLTGADKLVAKPIAGANRYKFEFANPTESYLRRITKTSYALVLQVWATNPLEYAKTYEVRVQASLDGGATYCPWGEVCVVTTAPVPPAFASNRDAQEVNASVSIWPNPTRGDQVNLMLLDLPEEVATATVAIYDVFGKQVLSQAYAAQGGFLNTVVQLDGQLASGMYMVNITAGDKQFVERLIVE